MRAEFDAPLQEQTLRRVTRRLLPFLMFCYLLAYLDRSNISVAALTMNADLGLTTAMYGFAAGIFYLSYILIEVPSNLMLAKFGARRWIARIMISWGIIAAGVSLVQSPIQLYAVRLLLGAAEAGFTPGIIFYLATWYPVRSRGRAMSFFYIGATLASVIGLPLSGAILQLNGLFGVAGWRWLFLVEGIPTLITGLVVLCYLPETPKKSRWLNERESGWLTDTIAAEDATHRSPGWGRAFTSRKVWLLALFWLLQAFATIAVTLFMPLIVKGLSGQNNLEVSLLSALPFLLACFVMYFNGRHSDRTGEYALHLGLPLALSGVLLVASVFAGKAGFLVLAYVLLTLSVGSVWGSTPVFWAVTTMQLSGVVGAAAIALINATANVAGLVLPPFIGWIRDVSGSYDAAILMIAGALVAGGVLGLRIAPPRQATTARIAPHAKAS